MALTSNSAPARVARRLLHPLWAGWPDEARRIVQLPLLAELLAWPRRRTATLDPRHVLLHGSLTALPVEDGANDLVLYTKSDSR